MHGVSSAQKHESGFLWNDGRSLLPIYFRVDNFLQPNLNDNVVFAFLVNYSSRLGSICMCTVRKSLRGKTHYRNVLGILDALNASNHFLFSLNPNQ